MQFLSWHRVSANHHELRALDGVIWADVKPYQGTAEWPARLGQMIGTVRMPDFHLRGGVEHWALTQSVSAAKQQTEAWMSRNGCAAEDFTIVPVGDQQARAAAFAALMNKFAPTAA